MKSGESAVFLHDIVRAAPVLLSTQPLLLRAMAIAVSTGRAVYDSVYLALAEAEGCELVTADDQFARGIRSVFPFVVSLAAMP